MQNRTKSNNKKRQKVRKSIHTDSDSTRSLTGVKLPSSVFILRTTTKFITIYRKHIQTDITAEVCGIGIQKTFPHTPRVSAVRTTSGYDLKRFYLAAFFFFFCIIRHEKSVTFLSCSFEKDFLRTQTSHWESRTSETALAIRELF